MFRKYCLNSYYYLNKQIMRSVYYLKFPDDGGPKGRAKVMIKLRKETRVMFGNLVETGRKRKKKLVNNEIENIVPENANKSRDTEIAWSIGRSNADLQRIVLLPKKNTDCRDIDILCARRDALFEAKRKKLLKSGRKVNEEKTKQDNILNVIVEEKEQGTEVVAVNAEYNQEEIVKPAEPKSTSLKTPASCIIKPLSGIIIKNILYFPIFDSQPKPVDEDNEAEIKKILSRTPNEDKENLDLPSVTKILRDTMSSNAKEALEAWKRQKIEELGQKGFDIYAKKLLEHGKLLHTCIESKLLKKDVEVPSIVEPALRSVESVLKDVKNVRAIESHVVHPKLQYRGIVDCIATYRGSICVIDWKKSDKEKLTIERTYDAPIQIASYVGAVNASPDYPFEITNGVVIVAYTSGKPAEIYRLSSEDLVKYWRLWLRRLQQYHVNARK